MNYSYEIIVKLASRRAVLPPTFAGQTHSLDEREVNGLFRWALNLLAAPSLKKKHSPILNS